MSTTEALVTARCDYCGAERPAAELYAPVPNGAVLRCRDVPACERRQIRAFDPAILPDEDMPRPPATGAPAGAACAVCGASGPDLYEHNPAGGQWMCRGTAGCQQRGVDRQFLTAWSDTSPDRLISAAQMRAMVAAAPPEVAAERPPASAEDLHAEAWRSAMGRRRER